MNASAESVSNTSKALRNMAKEMMQEVSKFKLN
jgi:methyl-accepting chemotaxis protein